MKNLGQFLLFVFLAAGCRGAPTPDTQTMSVVLEWYDGLVPALTRESRSKTVRRQSEST